jgi:hypothetical protein
MATLRGASLRRGEARSPGILPSLFHADFWSALLFLSLKVFLVCFFGDGERNIRNEQGEVSAYATGSFLKSGVVGPAIEL